MSLTALVREEVKKLKSCGFVLVLLENWKTEEEFRRAERSVCCG